MDNNRKHNSFGKEREFHSRIKYYRQQALMQAGQTC